MSTNGLASADSLRARRRAIYQPTSSTQSPAKVDLFLNDSFVHNGEWDTAVSQMRPANLALNNLEMI
jgi:hypothetical protein